MDKTEIFGKSYTSQGPPKEQNSRMYMYWTYFQELVYEVVGTVQGRVYGAGWKSEKSLLRTKAAVSRQNFLLWETVILLLGPSN